MVDLHYGAMREFCSILKWIQEEKTDNQMHDHPMNICSCFCSLFSSIKEFHWSVLIQEFNIEKLQLVEAEKKKLRQEYERKAKQVEVRKKM